jgi:hypothetical protein
MAFDSLIRDAQNFIGEQLGVGQDATSSSSPASGGDAPWDVDDKTDAFFNPQDIDPIRWNKLYPYRLLVIDVRDPSTIYKGRTNKQAVRVFNKKQTRPSSNPSGIEYVLTQEIANGSWEFSLPITPQMLRITDQFAINTSSTMRGTVEEHNGVKYKMISAAGTTGIWTQRPTVGGLPKTPTSLGSIFGGTLNAFSNVLEDLNRVKRAFSGDHPSSVADAESPLTHSSTVFSTGYYQAMFMGQFLERYAQLKKKPEGKYLRLVFDIPKQNQSFIVTPITFNLEQNQQKPMEYLFNFQLKSWKRINLQAPPPAANELPSLDANTFQRILGTIRETRRLLGNRCNYK